MIEQITVVVSDAEIINCAVSDIQTVTTVVGIQGPAGISSEVYYYHTQTSEDTMWVINHNLGKYPIIQVYSTGLQEIITTIQHISVNQARIYFNTPQKGVAICT